MQISKDPVAIKNFIISDYIRGGSSTLFDQVHATCHMPSPILLTAGEIYNFDPIAFEMTRKLDNRQCEERTYTVYAESLADIHNYLMTEYDYEDRASLGYMEIADVKRWQAYVKKFPISNDTLANYIDLATILTKAGLNDKARFLNEFILTFDPNNKITKENLAVLINGS